jgi:hypothetical protein
VSAKGFGFATASMASGSLSVASSPLLLSWAFWCRARRAASWGRARVGGMFWGGGGGGAMAGGSGSAGAVVEEVAVVVEGLEM